MKLYGCKNCGYVNCEGDREVHQTKDGSFPQNIYFGSL